MNVDLAKKIDEVCSRFEADWIAGKKPRIEDYLQGVGEAHSPILRELLFVELELLGRSGNVPEQRSYLERFPHDLAVVEEVFLRVSAPSMEHASTSENGDGNRPPIIPHGLNIRCPHCHWIGIVEDDPLVEVDCPSCGNSFALAEVFQSTSSLPGETEDFCAGEQPWENVDREAIPDRIDRYEICRVLGEGGFGRVYLAHDLELEREVALKVPNQRVFGRGLSVETFIKEARNAAGLKHPGIVTVYDV